MGFIEDELPKRKVILRPNDVAGYTGDPNLAVNAALNNAPGGSAFYSDPDQGGTGTLYFKQNNTASGWSLQLLGGGDWDGGPTSFTSTSGTDTMNSATADFSPTSGTADFVGLDLGYTINQTGGANGNYTAIRVNATETAAGGSANKLLQLQVGGVNKVFFDTNNNRLTAINSDIAVGSDREIGFTADTAGTSSIDTKLVRTGIGALEVHRQTGGLFNSSIEAWTVRPRFMINLGNSVAQWSINGAPDGSNYRLAETFQSRRFLWECGVLAGVVGEKAIYHFQQAGTPGFRKSDNLAMAFMEWEPKNYEFLGGGATSLAFLPTYRFRPGSYGALTAGLTVTDSVTLYVEGPPVAQDGDITLSNTYALWVDDGATRLDGDLDHRGTNIGVFGTAPTTQQTVTGSRGGNAALANLLTALANYGLIIDSTTA